MIDVILLFVVKFGKDHKRKVVLSIVTACLFRLTPQDGKSAARTKSSEPFPTRLAESPRRYMIRLPTNLNDGVSQPNETTSVDVVETVTFHNEEEVIVKEYPRYVSIGGQLASACLDTKAHDIKSFLGRPFLCASGVWSATHTRKTQLQTIELPAHCLNNASFADKVRGYYGFRAKAVCRVQVNSQKFQQGRLLLHYLPQSTGMSTGRKATALASLMTISQQPHVELVLNEDTEVRLEIPYVSTTMYYDLINKVNDFGTFYLTVYSPLATGAGTTQCSYSIWCHFEDVELAYPCAPQSGIKVGRGRGGKSAGAIDQTGAELSSEGMGPISGLMQRGSNAMAILSEIPLISSFTAPTSWMLSIMGRAANSLGYCKPTGAEPLDKRAVFAYMNNVNAVDNSTKLSLLSDNHVAELPGFAGTDIDEMSFNHFLSVSSYYVSNSWTTLQTVGTLVASFNLAPVDFVSVTTATVNSVAYPVKFHSPLSYLANIFQLYRGSITMTFKFSKTEFHSGRLLVAFFPGTGSNPSFANTQYVFREVIDIRKASEFSITFPWTSITPYLPVGKNYGVVQVFVINPLVAPENLSTSVDVIYEVSCAPDFEFAVPVPAREAPIVFVPQSGLSAAIGGKNALSASIDHDAVAPELEPALYCVGERVQSIRQLVKRFTTFWFNGSSELPYPTMMIEPSVHYLARLKITGGPASIATMRTDMLSYFSGCYRFTRGGVRVKIFDPAGLETYMAANIRVASGSTGPPIIMNPVHPKGTCDHPALSVSRLSGGAELEMPFYSGTHCTHIRFASDQTATEQISRPTTDSQQLLQVTQGVNFSENARVYRAASDDFSFGFFIGTMPTCSAGVFNPSNQ